MRILFLSYRLAHAGAISGQRIVYQRMKNLAARGHEVGLAAIVNRNDRPHIDSLRDMLFEIETVPMPRRLPFVLKRATGMGIIPPPYNTQYSPQLARVAGQMVERSKYEAVIAEFSTMGQHLVHNPWMPAVRKVISCHQCDTVGLRNYLDQQDYFTLASWPARLWYHRLKHYEFNLYRKVDRLLVLTPEERNELMAFSLNIPITIVRGGVDLDYFKPGPSEDYNRTPKLVYTGHFLDELNRDAFCCFVREVWPRLKARHPKLKFYVLGPQPSAEMKALARRDEDILLTGLIEDIRPYLHNADIFVCPIRMGSGLRGKVLEAMASGLPVASTSLGMEGIPAQNGRDCMIADDPRLMASNIDLLLSDRSLRDSIAQQARRLVERHFSWESSAIELEKTLREVLGKD
jgi:polysaccharide biosynthesis protein PslH